MLCLQETKCGVSAVPPEVRALPGLPHQFWASAEGRPGYSGVGLLAKTEPLNVTYGIGESPQTAPKSPQKSSQNCPESIDPTSPRNQPQIPLKCTQNPPENVP